MFFRLGLEERQATIANDLVEIGILLVRVVDGRAVVLGVDDVVAVVVVAEVSDTITVAVDSDDNDIECTCVDPATAICCFESNAGCAVWKNGATHGA